MVWWLDVRQTYCAAFCGALSLVIVACGPPAALPAPASLTDAAASEGLSSPLVGGRYYALGQVLAREQQRSAALEAQLEERTHEIEQLRADVEQMRQRETELHADLDRALANAGQGSAGTASAGAGAPQPAAAPPPAREPDAGSRAAEANNDDGGTAERAAQVALVASLRTQLSQEEQRRQSAEEALARLKEETSVPPFGPSDNPEQLAATQQEVADLRKALADERAARARMATEFHALQQRDGADANRPPETTAESDELRGRLQSLQAEKDALVENFNRSLGESQKRVWELEQQLATARVAAAALPADAAGDNVTAIREENTALRERLDEEHHRTEELAAKLKLATRVTDLIFDAGAASASRTRQRALRTCGRCRFGGTAPRQVAASCQV